MVQLYVAGVRFSFVVVVQDIYVINKKKMTFPNSCPGKSTWQESSSTSTWSQTLKSWSWPYTGPSFKAPHQRCIWTPWPGPSSSMGGLATNSPTSWRWCRSTGWGPRRSIFRSKLALVSLLPLVLYAQHLHELEHILVLVLLVDDDQQAGFPVVGVHLREGGQVLSTVLTLI